MKKLTAVILAISMLFAFTACGEIETDTTQTTAQPVETTVAYVEPENLTASDEDFDKLISIVRGIWLSSPQKISEDLTDGNVYFYNRSSDTALADAMYMLENQGVSFLGYADETYDLNVECQGFWSYDRETEEPLTIPADPMNEFGDSEYIRIDADAVDWILENILGVTPDRTKTDDDFETSKYYGVFNYYYFDGCYYYEVEEGGGGGMFPAIADCIENEDGSYVVTFSTYEEGSDDGYFVMEASAALREVDGKKVWSVSYLKIIDTVYAQS